MTVSTLNHTSESSAQSSSWSGVLAISVCAFVLVASEFLPVSLLTPISNDLGITGGMAGRSIAISGAFAVITSLFISTLAGSLDRKILLLCPVIALCIYRVSGERHEHRATQSPAAQ